MRVRLTGIVLSIAAVAACHRGFDDPGDHDPGDLDPVIGAVCVDDRDCLAVCEGGGDFPGGFCTLPCGSDLDCTIDSVCITSHDGVCVFPCEPDGYCGFLGPAYTCKEQDAADGGKVYVCLGD
jgi:hypothetical protein